MLSKISVAPMMACTDRHCRYLFRLLSPNTMLYSEMITTGALIHGNRSLLLDHHLDAPTGVQLGGSDPAQLAQAAQMVEQAGYQEVNLNCGCPSDRVQQGGIGACLMASPELVADCYVAMNEAVSIPVTIKSRIGIDDQDDYAFFEIFIEHLYRAGCRDFQIHARKAILTGLSPRENRDIPPLNYDFVRQIIEDFPEAEFVLNGGIKTVQAVTSLLTEFPGVMLGRAPYGNPYMLAEIDHLIFDTALPTRLDIAVQYQQYMEQQIPAGTHIQHMLRHLSGLYTGLPGARAFRRCLSTTMYSDDADTRVLDRALQAVEPIEQLRTGT